jgi:uncharacterized membrane protein YkvI
MKFTDDTWWKIVKLTAIIGIVLSSIGVALNINEILYTGLGLIGLTFIYAVVILIKIVRRRTIHSNPSEANKAKSTGEYTQVNHDKSV